MHKLFRTTLLVGLIAVSATAKADLTANVGFSSDYYYRGFFQKSASVSAGLDYTAGGFYVGTWAADVGDGLEVDLYGGYGMDLGSVNLSAGFTGYYYSSDFDDSYQEINLAAGFAGFTLDVAVGEYDNFDGPTQNYTFASLTYEHKGFYAKYGDFSKDFTGSYFEAGFGTTVAEIDIGISLILSDSDITGDDSDEALVLSIGKVFDF